MFVKDTNYIMRILNETGNFAGLELNLNKTEDMWMGKGFTHREFAGIKWPVNPARYLGVYFGRNDLCYQKISNFGYPVPEIIESAQL